MNFWLILIDIDNISVIIMCEKGLKLCKMHFYKPSKINFVIFIYKVNLLQLAMKFCAQNAFHANPFFSFGKSRWEPTFLVFFYSISQKYQNIRILRSCNVLPLKLLVQKQIFFIIHFPSDGWTFWERKWIQVSSPMTILRTCG